MSLPAPAPGLVIRYGYLWSDEAARGATEGAKDRPCAIVIAVPVTATGLIRTIVAPITHAAPHDPEASMELPAAVARMLGLDGDRHWIRLDELNRFTWPGFDLRPIGASGEYAYGLLPRPLYEEMRRRISAFVAKNRARALDRD